MVGAQGAGAVALEGVEVHEAPGGGFVQRVEAQDGPGVGDGGIIVAAVLEEPGETFQGAEMGLAEALAVGQDPVVVTTGEQVALVEVCGLCQGLAGGGAVRILGPG